LVIRLEARSENSELVKRKTMWTRGELVEEGFVLREEFLSELNGEV
jgi:hypothetical protein